MLLIPIFIKMMMTNFEGNCNTLCLLIHVRVYTKLLKIFISLISRASDSKIAQSKAIHFSWLGPELLSAAWSTGAQLIIFFCFRFSEVLSDRPGISNRHATHCICRVLVFASSYVFNLIYLLTVKIR